MVMHLSSGVGLGFYAFLVWVTRLFKNQLFDLTQLLNCRVSEPLSHQHIFEDITRPFWNRVFNLTRFLVYRVIVDYPNMGAHARVCLFQLHCPGSEKGKLSLLEREQVRLQSWSFPPDNFILIMTTSCGLLIICYGTSLLTGISQLWLHLVWLFSIVEHYLLGMILTLYVCLYIYIYMYVVV